MVRPIFSMMAASAIAVLAVPTAASAAIFVNGVEGDSTIRGHEKEVVASQVTFGSTANGTRPGPGGVMPQTVVITHQIDRASPVFFKNAVTSARIPVLKIELTKSTGGGMMATYLRITLTNARIASLSQSGSSGGPPTEQVTFVFEAAAFQFIPYSENGVAGTPVNATWDLVKNMVSQ